MKKIIIAVDGYSGTGKSSTAKALAKRFSYRYIDSGAMYRAATYYFLTNQVDTNDTKEVEGALSAMNIRFGMNEKGMTVLWLNGELAEDKIRTMEVNNHVSRVSAIPLVRREMVRQQRATGSEKGVVMDGRDIGTVVFPEADLKIFLIAELGTRATRRQQELLEKGIEEELSVIALNLKERDAADSTRADSPLVKAVDAVEIDTTNLTFDEQVHKIAQMAEEKINES